MMNNSKPSSPTLPRAFERKAAQPAPPEHYLLHLYVTGMTSRSAEAISAVRRICEKHLQGRYVLEIIDIYQNPELARAEKLVAVPTLVRKLPLPVRRLIGNLSDVERVLEGLGLKMSE